MENNEIVQADIFDALVPYIREIMTADGGFVRPGPLMGEGYSDNHIILDLPDNLVLDREGLSKYCDLRKMDIHAEENGWRRRPFHRTVTLHFTNPAAFAYLRDKFCSNIYHRRPMHPQATLIMIDHDVKMPGLPPAPPLLDY